MPNPDSGVNTATYTDNEFGRVLFVSSFPPSAVGGSAVIMRDLFERFPRPNLRLFVSSQYYKLALSQGGGEPPPWSTEVFSLPALRRRPPGAKTLLSIFRACAIPVLAWRVSRSARRWQADHVLAVQDSGEFLVGAWLASAITRTPLVVYMTDDWEASSRTVGRVPALIARLFLPAIAKRAASVWLISEDMQQEWLERFGVRGELLTHSVDLSLFGDRRPPTRASLRIACVGSVYSVNAKPLSTVMHAIQQARAAGHDIDLRLCTPTPVDRHWFGLENWDGITVDQVSAVDLPAALASADAGLVALAFDPHLRRVVETAYPTKLAEYLAAGLPVIVHGPASTTAAEVVRSAGCGVVLGAEDSDGLATALVAFANASEERAVMSKKARELAESRHDLFATRERFLECLRAPVTRAGLSRRWRGETYPR
jgi:glycosyltransferase involved in cell wall biosynthesis